MGDGDTGHCDKLYTKKGYCGGQWSNLTEYHLQVVDEFAGFNPVRVYNKRTGYGAPIPGQFEFKGAYDCLDQVAETGWIEIDISRYGDADVYIAAHAVMQWFAYPCAPGGGE